MPIKDDQLIWLGCGVGSTHDSCARGPGFNSQGWNF